jgi:hypothetical protein
MNFLSITQKTLLLAGIVATSSISTVEGTLSQIGGQTLMFREWVIDAYIDLQNLRLWPFLRSEASFDTVANTTTYTLSTMGATDLRKYNQVIYDDGTNYTYLKQIPYDVYIRDYVYSSATGKPEIYAIDPVSKDIYINKPDAAYSIILQYYTQPVTLAADEDIPLLPLSYHLLIAYLAAIKATSYYGNANLNMELQKDADYMLGNLMRDENPAKKVRLRGIV